MTRWFGAVASLVVVAGLGSAACSGGADVDPTPADTTGAVASPQLAEAPALLVAQAWFSNEDGRPTPQPAKLTI